MSSDTVSAMIILAPREDLSSGCRVLSPAKLKLVIDLRSFQYIQYVYRLGQGVIYLPQLQ